MTTEELILKIFYVFKLHKGESEARHIAKQLRARLTESVEGRGDDLATPRGDEETELPGMWDKSDLIGGETDCLPPPDTDVEPDELPGSLALQLAVQRGEWPHTMDASIWAEKFAEAIAADPTITSDRGMMIGWFANAIMAGYDTAAQRLPSAATPPTDALATQSGKKEDGGGWKDFHSELQSLINRYSKENGSNTPDFILAGYLENCLDVFDEAVTSRTAWHSPPTQSAAPSSPPSKAEGE